MQVKVRMVGSGTRKDPYRVDLPTWHMIECDTDKGKKPPNAYAIVEVPDDEVTAKGKISLKRLARKYKPTPAWTDSHETQRPQRGRDWKKQKPDIDPDMIDDEEAKGK